MKSRILVFVIALMPLSGFASTLSFELISLKSKRLNGIQEVIIIPKDGKLTIHRDPNRCADSGPCTKMAVQDVVVDAKVVSDARGTDGSLILQLTPEMTLSASSPFDMNGISGYTVTITEPGEKSRTLQMIPDVQLEVGK